MSIKIKTQQEIEKMRIAGRLAADVLDMITPHVRVGISTNELNQICHDYIVDVQKAHPSPLNYRNFPKSICTSVNNQVCHGIPSKKKLRKGDILNIDITVDKEEFHGDCSKMFCVGKTNVAAKRLVNVAQKCMYLGIDQIKPGARLGDIGHAIQSYAESQYCSVVREYCGHGIGRQFHEEPQVLHYGKPGKGVKIRQGMIFTVEPMINMGRYQTRRLPDGWTVVTKDRSLSAQWEHTILVTKTGYEILTLREEENQDRCALKIA